MEKLVKKITILYRWLKASTLPKNWFLRTLSLFLAIFLWYFVTGEDKVDSNVTIPIEIVNLPGNLIISNQYKKQLEVTISGPRGLIRGLSKQHPTRSIDLSKASPGTVIVKHDIDSIAFPRGIRVQRIQPTHSTFLLDQIIQKDLTIKTLTMGYPTPGFELGSITIRPPTVTINGPKSLIGNKSFLQTNPIDLSGLKESTDKQVTLDVNEDINSLLSDPIVTAHISIVEKRVRKNYSEVHVILENPIALSYIISPPTVKIEADLPFKFIGSGARARDLIKARINADGLPPGRHELKVEIAAPPEIRINDVNPKMVFMIISEQKQNKNQKSGHHP
ncbi:MAG: hypothetical protein A2511_15995 [Deltaproteobacteria bacterium RIFOXYD12_FULL_50_9]|nr:MAG: hypothetical protein A2511_15995 [Deltaproteobacteria bacterium RIFOXYD12_FULL_50_9]